MALACVACHTENRDAAKFCKGCGGQLVDLSPAARSVHAAEEAWSETLPAAQEADPASDGGEEKTVILAPPARAPSNAPRPVPSPSPAPVAQSGPAAAGGGRGPLWALAAVVLIAAVMGGGYAYRSGHRGAAAGIAAPAAPAATVLPASPSVAAEVAPAVPATGPMPGSDTAAAPAAGPALSGTVAADIQAAQAAPPPVAAPPVPASPAAPRKPRQTPAAAPSPVARPAAAAPPATAATPQEPPAPPPADPQSACEGRNFIAKAQCMAAQCVKAEFAAHAQCEAVRRQQRIEEEKRNPTGG
jgi:hypothetical protein